MSYFFFLNHTSRLKRLNFIIQYPGMFLNIPSLYSGKIKLMTYYILANPFSGHGHGKRVTKTLIQYLDQEKIAYQLFETQEAFDEPRLIKTILKNKTLTDKILIIGGDGTLSLSLNALPKTLAFSYIPAGSGNDFARALGLPLNQPIEIFKALHHAKPHDIHVLKYESTEMSGIAMNNIGIGLDAAIVACANNSPIKDLLNRLKLGQLAYLFSALSVLWTKKSFAITTNRSSFDQAYLFTLTNHPFFGGGIPLAPDAKLTNSAIHLVELDYLPIWQIAALIPKVFKGKHFTNKHVHHQVSETFTLRTSSKQPMQIDGETYQLSPHQMLHVSTEKRLIIC